ncbi:discoidin domain-containing protein [Kitasatospora sp. MBT63]|uniref:discoidin domain-containing protein n=1 Tax=Kitasatospora sp. MBT63 TaxID=1444768 RepID=UPI00053AE400|nr:discoidin domain-containing protein [Kitasatospora sp. MBT63]
MLGLALLSGAVLALPSTAAHAADTLISQGKAVTASSTENGGTGAALAVDGSTGTRWSSAASDQQWLQVDLGATATIGKVVLNWEAAYGKAYQIQTSADGTTWTTVYATTTGTGGTETLTVSGSGRYVRMNGITRGTGYGYSLWEFQVFGSFTGTTPGGCGTANAAQGRPATASSTENGGTGAALAVDGSTGTRWSSAASDPQWLQVDLGSTQQICQVVLNWETAYGKAYQLQTSDNGTNWTTVYSTTTGTGGTETLSVSGSGRYLRMNGTARGTAWGYSLWELAVHTGSGGPSVPPVQGGGDLGPNVLVFDPATPGIQAKVDEVFAKQESNQFGSDRYALLFKPGTYSNINAQIGFYTSIAGLGLSPDDTVFNGDVTVDAGWFGGNATQNFWRSAENLSLKPVSGTDRWAVSQAAPFRRMHVQGGLNLAPNGYGWASGGYIADSKIDGTVGNYSQQQWYTRDSAIGGFTNGVWNQTFSGVQGAPAQGFPNPPYTTLATTPVSREKPFLYLDGNDYKVFVPGKRTNATGVSWANGPGAGTSLPLSQFYVVKPGATAATIDQALAQGLNLLFTPGVYHVDRTIEVTRPGTVVLGLGLATVVPDNGVVAMRTADVDGIRLAGLLFDAGTVNSPALLQVGPDGATADHAADPTTVQDVFARIGGAGPGSATTAMVVNANSTIVDHTWLWRADHGAGVGWTANPSDYGMVVRGNDVLATGLFVEHFKKYDVEWSGERGRTIFYQNEIAYDAPDQAAVQNGATKGFAAYKVDDNVTVHEGWGLGSYCYFNVDPTIRMDHGFEAPNRPGVKFHDILVNSLGGKGQFDHVINDVGAATSGTSTTPSNVVSYP